MERAFRSGCGYLFLTGVEALLEQTTMGALSGDRLGERMAEIPDMCASTKIWEIWEIWEI